MGTATSQSTNLRKKADANSRKAIWAASIGNLLEWYDFGVYAFLATMIAANFFPGTDPTAALLATFAAYGVGFLARPFGGVVIGRFGDKFGRKFSLVLTLMMMAIGTIGIGLLPTYETIGIWAPILLVVLRILQGIAAGGEWGASTAFIIEWAPSGKRGLFGSFQQVSTAGGTLLGSAVAAILVTMLGSEIMIEWGWRIPFILGFVLLFVGIYIRRNIEETPAFIEAQNTVVEVTADVSGPRLGLRAFGFTIFWTVAYYTLLSYMPTFTQKYGGLTQTEALWSNTIGLITMVCAVPFMGLLSDRIGRKPVLLTSVISAVVLAYPLFSLVTNDIGFINVVLVQMVFGLIMACYSGPGPAAISEIFPTHLRSTWMSTGYTFATAVFGGFAPFMAIWLISVTESPTSPTYFYMIPAAIITFFVVLRLPETATSELK